MVFLNLMVSAELENITNLCPADPERFTYYFKIKCSSCGEVSEKETSVTKNEKVDIPNSRGEANLVQKCKMCERFGTITIVDKVGGGVLETGQAALFAQFECRGIEPVDWAPKDGFVAEGLTGKKFEEVDLEEGEWADYDDKANESVCITEISSEFIVGKNK
mmetsp:Transcript_62865/g.199153  ORF Transcript_62865/g.199153 Transcript_62865/m.199153 type:complete len:162 (+) Transcript_62865:92-577(+)